MRRIQNVSSFVRVLLLALLVIEGAGMAVGLFVIPSTLFHISGMKSHVVYTIFTAFLLFLPLMFLVTLNFFRLFTRLKNGWLFESETIEYLERAGKWWITLSVVSAIVQLVESYVFRPDHIIVPGNGIWGGLIVFFIAWVLREGQQMKEEQELTV